MIAVPILFYQVEWITNDGICVKKRKKTNDGIYSNTQNGDLIFFFFFDIGIW
jgi:hypothetical protein